MKKYDTFWQRFFALIIDGIVLAIFGNVSILIFNKLDPSIEIMSMLINLNFPYLYSIGLHAKYGQTLGKRMLNIRIVSVKNEGPIGYGQAFERDIIPFILANLFFVLAQIITWDQEWGISALTPMGTILLLLPSAFFLFWWVLELFTMLFHPKFRALHDLIAETAVIRTEKYASRMHVLL